MNYIILILPILIGALFVFYIKPRTKFIQLLLSFSGAYLLSITVLHLLPEVFESKESNIGLFILVGILLQTILEYFSKGVEHGHVHINKGVTKIPWLLFISLFIHAFIEGLPLGNENSNTLLWAIVIHKIPISIVLIAFLFRSDLLKKYAILLIVLFALMSPLGVFLNEQLLYLQINQNKITAIVIGVFLHIATAILFESTENHQFNMKKFLAVLLGFSIAFASTEFLGH